MNLSEEAKRVIDIYNTSKNNLDFTLYVSRIEKSNPDLFNAIIQELSSGNYQVKYLNSTGQ
jgi:hypothetical protein